MYIMLKLYTYDDTPICLHPPPPRSKSLNYLNVTLVATGQFLEHITVEVFVDDVDDQLTLSKAQVW